MSAGIKGTQRDTIINAAGASNPPEAPGFVTGLSAIFEIVGVNNLGSVVFTHSVPPGSKATLEQPTATSARLKFDAAGPYLVTAQAWSGPGGTGTLLGSFTLPLDVSTAVAVQYSNATNFRPASPNAVPDPSQGGTLFPDETNSNAPTWKATGQQPVALAGAGDLAALAARVAALEAAPGRLIAAVSFKSDGTVNAQHGGTLTKLQDDPPDGRFDFALTGITDPDKLQWWIYQPNDAFNGSGSMNGSTLEITTLDGSQQGYDAAAFVLVWQL